MASNFLQNLGENAFKTTADGKRLFFPNGVLGKGYVVDSEETYQRLRSYYKWWFLAAIVGGPILPKLFTWQGFIVAVVLFGFAYRVGIHQLTRNLPVADERLTFQDAQANIARTFALGAVTLSFVAIFGAFFFCIGAILLTQPTTRLPGAGIATFGVAVMFLAVRALIKRRHA